MERVRERLLRAVAALEHSGVEYAVAGGHAVAAWVATVDEAATRQTRDVDVLIRRADLPKVRAALEEAGFVFRHVAGVDVFLDGPESKVREGVHLVFSNEFVRPDEPAPNPDVSDSVLGEEFRMVTLESLVRIKLTAFRDKDKTHLRDLIEVGLVDRGWLERLAPPLSDRLKELLDNPQ